jgi:tRNA (guanine6-N2)-methyltransferase
VAPQVVAGAPRRFRHRVPVTSGAGLPGAGTAPGRVRLMARTVRGLEWVAAAELRGTLGVWPQVVDHRELRFELPGLPPELLHLATVDDVLGIACEVEDVGRPRAGLAVLCEAATRCDLGGLRELIRALRPVPDRPSFDVSATFRGKRNFNRFELEDAAGSGIATAIGWRYESRSGGRRPPPTDISIRVHLSGERATIGVRLASAPLHRRDYRRDSRRASLRPPVARAIALLAGLAPGGRLLDPFCGAGTIGIEALLAEHGMTSAGYDADPASVASARANARRARVQATFEVARASALPVADAAVDRVASNPPWERAVRASGPLTDTWRELRRVLSPDGRVALVGPDELLDAAAVGLALESAPRAPIGLLGQRVAIAVLAPDGRLTAPGQLLGAELDDAFVRFADAVAVGPP